MIITGQASAANLPREQRWQQGELGKRARCGADARRIACCRALRSSGFGDIPLPGIERYVQSAQQWTAALRALINTPECRYFFAPGDIRMDNISQLARVHDSRLPAPSRTPQNRNLQEIAYQLRHARRHYRQLRARITVQDYWIDTAALPLSEATQRRLCCIVQHHRSQTDSAECRQAVRWLSAFLRPGVNLQAQLACGRVHKLSGTLEQVLRFSRNRHYRLALGAEFKGLHSDWNRLYSNNRFFTQVQRALRRSRLEREVLDDWTTHESRFFILCRRASFVQRRMLKLNSLVKQQYFTPAESTGYIALAEKSIDRLDSWLVTVQGSHRRSNLTPQQLLEKLLRKNLYTLRVQSREG